MADPTVENPDATMRYGGKAVNVADIFEPAAPTDSLVLLLPGGFWREADRVRTWSAGHALASAGHLTAAIAYSTGPGSWQSAFDDVVAAIDQVQLSGREWTRDNAAPRTITLVGHSAGGQLALWAASRTALPDGSRWRTDDVQVTGVVALAPVADLARAAELGLGDDAVVQFLGGSPTEVPDAYAIADPAALRPSIPARILHGDADDSVPVALSEGYVRGVDSGSCGLEVVAGAGHMDWADPTTQAWTALTATLDDLIGG